MSGNLYVTGLRPSYRRNAMQRRRSAGFALPLAVMMGALMTVVALTMLVRSRTSRIASSAQLSTAESLAAAEAGLDRTIAQLNQTDYSYLLELNYDPSGLLGSPVSSNDWLSNLPICISSASQFASDILNGAVGNGSQSYEVLAYRYAPPVTPGGPGTGTLLLQGESGQAATRIRQEVPVMPATRSFPGLLGVIDVSLGNNDVFGLDGNVVCTNPVPVGSGMSGCEISCTQYLTDRSTAFEDAIDAQSNSFIGGQVFLGGSVELPPLPTYPIGGAGAYDLGSIVSSTSLPRVGDIPDSDGVYHYRVSDIVLSGGGRTLSIVPPLVDSAIYLYVDGNITLSGNAAIDTDLSSTPSDPAAVRIYGSPTNLSQSISLNGGTCLEGFIYAPNATMGINGGSCAPADIVGAVWVKEWNGSSSNIADIRVPDNMDAALGAMSTSFASNSGRAQVWQRQGADN